MKKLSWILLLLAATDLRAQELFVFTEPASNMPTRSLGLRLDNSLYRIGSGYAYRLQPEVMWGASRGLMIHVATYLSNVYQPAFKWEGGSLYAKYRLFAKDGLHRHFRLAAFAKAIWVNNPDTLTWQGKNLKSDEIDLNGNNPGWLGGIVGTQLLNRLALSGALSYVRRWPAMGSGAQEPVSGPPGESASAQALDYSFSGGFLLLPRHYKNFKQTNVNLMCEWLGSQALDKQAGFLDVAPAVQFIFNSISRLDLGYRVQVAGNMDRFGRSGFFLRMEYNFLRAY